MEKVIGVVYAYDAQDEYADVYECGFRWIRSGVPFPWEDGMHGALSRDYQMAKEECQKAKESGLKVMGSTFGMGCWRYDASDNATRWRDEIPAFVGEKGTKEYYANLRKAAAFIAKDLHGLVDGLWQCMNEIDNPTFAGPYSMQIVADTARALAEGIVSADPGALCGINLSRYCEEALAMADIAYRAGHSFGYIGDDQYFGSWQGKSLEHWNTVIQQLYDRYRLPVLANEWGYSSGGGVAPKRPDPALLPDGWPDVCYEKKWFHAVDGGHTEDVQADYIRQGLELFARNPHVLGSFLFCWKDAVHCYHCGQTDCPSECYWGIVDSHKQPKAAYYAAKEAINRYYGSIEE